MKALILALLLVLAPSAGFGQQGKGRRGPEARASSNMSHEERRRLREDVDSARYDRRDMRRQDRMAPGEREKLRRDVQDANRDIRKR